MTPLRTAALLLTLTLATTSHLRAQEQPNAPAHTKHVYAVRGESGLMALVIPPQTRSKTPVAAVADARAAIRWLRAQSGTLGIDPDRIALYGWSAGAHLGMSAAIFGDSLDRADPAATPNAFALMSPALAISDSGYFERLLLARADAFLRELGFLP